MNTIYYVPNVPFGDYIVSATNAVVRRANVNLGRACTFNGYRKKMISAGYKPVYTTLVFPDGSDEVACVYKKSER